MYDTIYNNQFPAGAEAYAAYVDGGLGNQPNYAYIVNTWQTVDLTSLAGSKSLGFALSSTDNGPFGMNTPA